MDIEGKVFWGLSEILPSGKASRIKIYGEKNGDTFEKYPTDHIRSYFPPSGKVFTPSPINSFCTFHTEVNNSKKENGDEYITVSNSVKLLGHFNLMSEKKLSNEYLSMEELQEISNRRQDLEDGICYINIIDTKELIGPFVKDNKGLMPKIGKEAVVYDASSGLNRLILEDFNGSSIFFNSPDICLNKKTEIDCMSGEQLQEWFRAKLKEAREFSDEKQNAIDVIIKMLKERSLASANDLDTVRFKRILENLDQYKFSYDELKELLMNDGFEKISQKIEDLRSEIKQEYESQLRAEIQSLYEEKTKIENEKDILSSDFNELKSIKGNIEKEIELLTENRESLMLQFRLSAQMDIKGANDNNARTLKPVCYEIPKEGNSFSEHNTDDDTYKDLELYYRIIEKNLYRAGYGEELISLYKSDENSLLKSQAVFVPCVSWAYIFAQSIGNAKVYTMHIEHDWLHYRDFCDNGLVSIWNEASKEKDKNCVLVLEDINITQIECGCTPLLDVLNGYRPVLEGTEFCLPKNLKIFATVIPPSDENTGLKLQERLFRKWGRFGNFTDIQFMYPLENKTFVPFGYFDPDNLSALYDDVYHQGGSYFDVQ
jgi:hypothetical protein